MIFSYLMNALLGYAMFITLLFCIGPIDQVFEVTFSLPFAAIFQENSGSTGGAIAMVNFNPFAFRW